MMSYSTSSRLALVAALLAGTAATADVTAEDVWANWEEQMGLSAIGDVTVGSETYEGGVLTISGLSFTSSDGEVAVSANMGDLVFTENGDGTVSVTVAERYEMMVGPDGSNSEGATLAVISEGASILASGDPGAITYDIAYSRQAIELVSLMVDGQALNATGALNINDVAGTYTMASGEAFDFDYALTAGSIDMTFNMDVPEERVLIDFSGAIADASFSAAGSIPEAFMTEVNPDPTLIADMAINFAYQVGPADYALTFDVEGDFGEAAVSAAGAGIALIFNKDSFGLLGGAQGVAVALNGFEIPFPVEVSMEEYFYGAAMPLSASDEPRDFGLKAGIVGLAVNDILWSLVDPTGQIPHDPVTVTFDVAGTGSLDVNLLEPEGMMAMDGAEFPGTLNTLTITNTLVDAAGARATAEGAFEFDMNDLDTLDGFPFPVGEIVVTAEGVNALMANLVAMGLLPQEQVMGAQMMMGMFAETVGEDQLRSTVETRAGGQLFVNGSRLQ